MLVVNISIKVISMFRNRDCNSGDYLQPLSEVNSVVSFLLSRYRTFTLGRNLSSVDDVTRQTEEHFQDRPVLLA